MSRTPPGLDTPLTGADVQTDALGFLRDLTHRFGDVARYAVEGRQVVFLNRPEYAKHVLQERHRTYQKVDTPDMMMLKPMLGEGLLTTDGETWMEQRRFTQPAFHRDEVEAFADIIVEETERSCSSWTGRARSGEAFEIGDELTQLTTRIVARALFGADVTGLVASFGAAVQAMNEFMGHYDPKRTDRLQRFLAARSVIDKVIRDIIAQRTSELAAGADAGGDFLSMLLQARDEGGKPLSAQSVRDQALTLLMAGHETTAKALTWTLYLLDKHPEQAATVRAEIDTLAPGARPGLGDLRRMPKTWQALQEGMRLYPPVWIISRTAVQDDEVDGWRIPAGTLVVVSPYMLHRHPDSWDRPGDFDISRFAEGVGEERHPFAFLPFSGGPRICIGKHFATLEMHMALAMILRRWNVGVEPGHPVEPEALVTLRPRFGMNVTLSEREGE